MTFKLLTEEELPDVPQKKLAKKHYIFKAQYSGRCDNCRGRIRVGTKVAYSIEKGHALYCVPCLAREQHLVEKK